VRHCGNKDIGLRILLKIPTRPRIGAQLRGLKKGAQSPILCGSFSPLVAMIEVTLLLEEKVAILRPIPPLVAADFENVGRELGPAIERLGQLSGLMIVAPQFPAWEDLCAVASHLRFVRDHHKQVARVALVSDSAALRVLPAVGRAFVAAEVRFFRPDAEDAARAWLNTPAATTPGLRFHRSDDPPVMWIEIDGKVTLERYREMRDEMENALAAQNGGAFLIRLKELTGIEPSALLADLRFSLTHLTGFKRVAMVGDAGWLDRAARVVTALIPGEVRAFSGQREQEAWDWVKGGPHHQPDPASRPRISQFPP
jgi:hypothetical protein